MVPAIDPLTRLEREDKGYLQVTVDGDLVASHEGLGRIEVLL